MANIPQTIPLAPPSGVVSYSYTDIAEGTGVVKFYLSETEDNGGSNYILTSQVSYSRNIRQEATGAGTPKSDLDFDLSQFALPQDIEGTGYANIAMGAYNGAAGDNVYIIVRVRKWDGTSETTLVSTTSDTHTFPATSTQQWVFSVPLVIPFTHFAEGDVLRVTVETYVTHAATTLDIGHDPKNRGYTTGGAPAANTQSESTVFIPFRPNDLR